MSENQMELLDFPDEVLTNIFSFLSYADLSTNREVCTRFNNLCGSLLTKGFTKAEKFHASTFKLIKSKLPRRESERRAHPLSKHCDILTAVETRISMLTMTYLKWIDSKACPFIPGKVLDEIMKVLRKVKLLKNAKAPRTHEMLQELRDISSMAMEHFDEVVIPMLKENLGLKSKHKFPGPLKLPPFNLLGERFVTLNQYNKLVLSESDTRRKLKEQGEEITELRKQIAQLEARISGMGCVLNHAQAAHADEIDVTSSECIPLPGKSTDEPVPSVSFKRPAEDTAPNDNKKMKV